MDYLVNGKNYKVNIIKKANKNTYIRFKNDEILVTAPYFVTQSQIETILNQNHKFLIKMIEKSQKQKEKDESYFYLGEKYDIIITNSIEEIDTINKKIYVSSSKRLEQIITKKMRELFSERLSYNYQRFDEKIPYPSLTIRKMTTRWGVCNRKLVRVTLNSELIKHSLEELDYVIIHELAHLVVFNHSRDFWQVVSKYCSDYKLIRRRLKE